VLTKSGKDHPMIAAAEMMDDARSRVAELVERRARETGSWMWAYQDVGSLIGRSESWVRKLIGRTLDTKRPDAVALQNIRAVYARMCGAIEADAQRREANAVHQRSHQVAQGVVERAAPVAADPMEIPEFLRRTR
jgi:hypothetical protein